MGQVSSVQLESFDYGKYNRLLSPEEASERLNEKNFKNFLAEACILLDKKEYAYFKKLLGLRLLHRHHEVKLGQILAEVYEEFRGKKASVTKLEQLKEQGAPVPASWMHSDEGIKVFEYSHDQNVKDLYSKLQQNGEIIVDLINLLRKHGLEKVLSIAILDRSWHSNYPSDQKFVENTYDEPYPASVLDDSSIKEGEIPIRTAWPFDDSSSVEFVCVYMYICVRDGSGFHRRASHHS
jgi:hypothetical protein